MELTTTNAWIEAVCAGRKTLADIRALPIRDRYGVGQIDLYTFEPWGVYAEEPLLSAYQHILAVLDVAAIVAARTPRPPQTTLAACYAGDKEHDED